jgi:hypothetical protein
MNEQIEAGARVIVKRAVRFHQIASLGQGCPIPSVSGWDTEDCQKAARAARGQFKAHLLSILESWTEQAQILLSMGRGGTAITKQKQENLVRSWMEEV